MPNPQLLVKMVGLGGQADVHVLDTDDDQAFAWGDDRDFIIHHRSTTLAANTALSVTPVGGTAVTILAGTPDTPALAANSVIISNATQNGDILFAVNDGGTSKGLLWFDGSAGQVVFPDSQGAYFGDGGDARIYYDGSNLYIDPDVVGTGNVIFPNGSGIVIGHTAQVQIDSIVPEVQVLGTGGADSSLALMRFSNDTAAPELHFGKSRGAIGAFNIVSADDEIGRISWSSTDGLDLDGVSARIRAFVGPGPSQPNDVPGYLTFETTAETANSPTERLRIDSSGDTLIANGGGLVVGHSAQVTTPFAAEFQVHGTAPADSMGLIGRWTADANPPVLGLAKSRNASIGSFTIVQDGDTIGSVSFYADDGTDLDSEAARISAAIDGTPGANDTPGRLVFLTTADGAQVPTERARIDAGGTVYINDTANANMTVGLTINQGANDDKAFALKSSDVNHPMTGVIENDTYFAISKFEAAAGGTLIAGYKDATGNPDRALGFQALLGETASTDDTSSSRAIIENLPFVTDGGTSTAAVAAGGNAWSIRTGSATLVLVKGNGTIHATNVTAGGGDLDGVALDNEDDVGLIRLSQRMVHKGLGVAMSKWDDAIKANEDDLKRLGVISSDGHFRILQRYEDLLGGAIWQLHTRLMETAERLEAAETKLHAMEAA